MKSILLTACVLLLGSSYAQNYVTIPDANFAKYLKEVVPNAINGNQLDTSSADVKNLKKIDAEARAIKNLDGVQYFTGLDTLDVGNGKDIPLNSKNQFSTLPKLPINLKYLICGNVNLDSLPQLPESITSIMCYENNLISLPNIPVNLKYLMLNHNKIKKINFIKNSNIEYLLLMDNKIDSMYEYPKNLKVLNLSLNQLKYINTNLPLSIDTLYIFKNFLNNLPTLPSNLIYLDCNNNNLTSLPSLPNNLKDLNCDNNRLTLLPTLPIHLDVLSCSYNQLSSLPSLPKLSFLFCDNNKLDSLPLLTKYIQTLDCSFNNLFSLPQLPKNLSQLICNNNKLHFLPELPKGLNWLICSNNNINCFSLFYEKFNDVQNTVLQISGNPIKCLPNYVVAMDSITLSYPLCSDNDPINNPNNCSNGQFGILGSNSFDSNKNCHKDSLETPLANIPMVLLDSANNLVSQTYTAMNGVYQFPVGANNYNVQIDTTNLPFSALCPKGGDTTIVLSDSSIFAKDVNFNLTCKVGFDVGIRSVATSGIVFPGQPHNLYVTAGDMSNWFGRHCAEGISGQLQITVTGPVKYVATAGTKTPTINGNVYTYEIADFGKVDFTRDFGLSFVTDTTAKADDQICVNAQITPKNGDYNVTNNTYDYCYSVINSHDPNLKEVYPANFKPGYDGYLTYTVHFQNTGSAQAFNIRLVDTLDAKLDLKTFEVLNYSHANTVSLTGNVMRVKYPNILLSDSTTNEKASHGFIQYRIKPLAPISEEHQIKNTAYIYFDYNDAIVTNTTVSKANKSLGIHEEKEIGLRVYPNPTENLLTFERTSHTINTVNVSIISVNGQVMFTNTLDLSNKKTVDLTNYAPGVYFVNVQNEEATDVIKVIKK